MRRLLLLLSLAATGCECAAGSTGECTDYCSDAMEPCPDGLDCIDGCCRCRPSPETCNGTDDDCDRMPDDGVEACACAPGGPGPSEEICNGIDDDCNEMVDDGVDVGDEVCNALDDDCNGTVDDGVPNCACAPGGPGPSAEVCNGVDDDCNGMIDDGTMDCGGTSACACAPGGPGMSAETCNGLDDDCDGAVDEEMDDCACMSCGGPSAEECNLLDDDCNGMVDDTLDPAVCPCAPGGPGPTIERCNNIDDDCDGMVDDGVMNCACAPGGPGPSAEVCNRIDDDCNGMVDDGIMNCACSPGGPGPSMELCNRIDDDCDAMVDEVNSRTGMPCRQFGEPCAMNSDCSSQLCTGDAFEMYCTERCMTFGNPGDCPAGYRCWDNPSPTGDDICRRNYTPCARDADCAAGEVCAPTCDDLGTSAVTECRPRIAGGADAPAACMRDRDCASNDCFRTDICTEICAGDADCAPGHRCVLVGYPSCGGGDYIPRCLDACDCDTECPAGQFCQPYVHVAPTRTTRGACDVSYGPLAPGADCDNTMGMFCEHAICSRGGTGFCTQVCSATCGCPAGIGPCGNSTVTFPNLGSFPAMTCATM